MARIVFARSSVDIRVPEGESIAVFTQEQVEVFQKSGEVRTPLGTVTATQQTFGPFLSGATISLDAGDYSAIYAVGVTPIIRDMLVQQIQRAPEAINASGAIPLTALYGGVINATAGLLGVTGTLPTGAAIEALGDFRVDDSFDWHVISTGLGTFTVAASAGHTLVGAGGVGSAMSGVFRTRKTAINTFVTYRIG